MHSTLQVQGSPDSLDPLFRRSISKSVRVRQVTLQLFVPLSLPIFMTTPSYLVPYGINYIYLPTPAESNLPILILTAESLSTVFWFRFS